MSHLPFTLLAYLFNSISVVIGKFLINKSIPDPLVYIFYISALSLLALFGIPFVKTPTAEALVISSASTVLWTLAAYFMFKALKVGQVSRVIPVIGTFIPLILLLWAFPQGSMTQNEVWAIGLLIIGLIFITSTDWKGKISKQEIFYEMLSALLFAVSYILLRAAYNYSDFVSILVYSRLILIPLGIFILIVPDLRDRVFKHNESSVKFLGLTGFLFLFGQICGGISEFLLLYSISLADPALVNSLQGTQYIFLLIFALFLAKKFPSVFKEHYSKLVLFTKLIGIILIGLGLYTLSYAKPIEGVKLGATFSPRYATDLGLDPKETFIRSLDELKVKSIRLPVYWDEVEINPNQFNFSEVDYYLEEAKKRDVEVMLVLGYKQPRWPECFEPSWVKGLALEEKEQKILKLVQTEVEHFKKYSNIKSWQVENEPYFLYGICNPEIIWSTEKEVEIVKARDRRPVLLTDSGEMGFWFLSIKNGNNFGSTLYRKVWGPIFGTTRYPLPPIYYRAKNDLTRALTGNFKGTTIISELQAEPWIPGGENTRYYPTQKQAELLTVKDIEGNLNYAKQTGFSEIYLWGLEWWYFMEQNNHPQYLEYAKKLF